MTSLLIEGHVTKALLWRLLKISITFLFFDLFLIAYNVVDEVICKYEIYFYSTFYEHMLPSQHVQLGHRWAVTWAPSGQPTWGPVDFGHGF